VPAGAWTHASCGPGSKGDRDYAWAWLATASSRHHLLIRRSLTDPADLAFFTCHVPEGRPATLPVLAAIAGRRWPVEEDFQVGKSHFGLADSQVRTYTALHCHIALAMAAAAICATAAAAARPRAPAMPRPPTSPQDTPPDDPGLIPFTVAEIKRLLNLLLHLPATTCRPCPVRDQCTTSKTQRRQLTVHPRQTHDAQRAARARQTTTDWQGDYTLRAGVEGTLRQAIAVTGLRHTRYRDLAKTHLEHVFSAAALNLIRLDSWWNGHPLDRTRTTHLARLELSLAA